MKQLIDSSAFTRAGDLSHSLKGASGNVSAMALFDSAKALEQPVGKKEADGLVTAGIGSVGL